MKIIRVYGKPRCVQCDAVTRWLQKNNIDYIHEDATDEMNTAAIKELGYTQAPVVIVSTPEGDVHWSGFDPGKLKEYAA